MKKIFLPLLLIMLGCVSADPPPAPAGGAAPFVLGQTIPFPDFNLFGVIDRTDSPGADAISWSGRLIDVPGFFTIVRTSSGTLWKVTTRNRVYVTVLDSGGNQKRLEIDPSTVPEECNATRLPLLHEPGAISSGAAAMTSSAAAAVCASNSPRPLVQIDVIVGYTPAARLAAGGKFQVEMAILALIDETNQALSNSLIPARLQAAWRPANVRPRRPPGFPPLPRWRGRPVDDFCIFEAPYTEPATDVADKALHALIDPSDGVLDRAHPARDGCKADIGVLVFGNVGPIGGKANILPFPDVRFAAQAFAVARFDSAVANTAFSHEVGHLFGAAHDVENQNYPPEGMCPDSAGWRFLISGAAYRTIMSYKCPVYPCAAPYPALPDLFYSAPNIWKSGVPVGTPAANNRKTISLSAETVSKYR